MRTALILTIVLCFRALAIAAEPPLTLPGVDQQDHMPLAVGSKKAVVLFFVSPYCPTSNTFVPEMNKIAADYADNFSFYFVHADPDQKYTDILQHMEMNAIKATVLMDKKQRLAKLVGAKTTPETVVLNAEGKALYQGRINDLYLSPTRRQRQATTKELRDALDAISSGKPITVPHTDTAGCKITGLK